MTVQLHEKQREVALDTHRFRVLCAGRRFGKSVLADIEALRWAIEHPNGLVWIVSPTYKQSKQIHWRGLKSIIPQSWIVKTNEVELSITLRNSSIIELKGAENPDTLRGVKLRGIIVDEIASIRNWDWLWSEVLRPTLTDFQSPGLFISTPKGFNHFYDLFQRGLVDGSEYKSWQYTSYDNPYIKPEEIDQAKKEQSEDTFAQEYMADFRKATGLAFKTFDRTIHLIDNFEVPNEWQRARGFDYGSNDPTASVRVALDNNDNWFVDRCYKNHSSTIKDHALAIKAQDYGYSFVPIYGDPSGSQWELEFAQNGLNIQSANKEIGQGSRGWVEYGVEVINQRLKPIPGHTVRLLNGKVIENAPKLFILNTIENQSLVKEMELLKWRETTSGQTVPILDESIDPDGHSDLCAALRYLTVSYKKPIVYTELENDISNKDWRI